MLSALQVRAGAERVSGQGCWCFRSMVSQPMQPFQRCSVGCARPSVLYCTHVLMLASYVISMHLSCMFLIWLPYRPPAGHLSLAPGTQLPCNWLTARRPLGVQLPCCQQGFVQASGVSQGVWRTCRWLTWCFGGLKLRCLASVDCGRAATQRDACVQDSPCH